MRLPQTGATEGFRIFHNPDILFICQAKPNEHCGSVTLYLLPELDLLASLYVVGLIMERLCPESRKSQVWTKALDQTNKKVA